MTLFMDKPTRFLFFTGKGGVGKTSLACSTAVRLADQGKRILLVSTDPASNLDEVLGVRLSSNPIAIPEVKNLFALNIDPNEAAKAYRDRSIGPYRGVLPPDSIRDMEEQLSGACTVEVAAFDEFTSLLLNSDVTSRFDHIIFDTAPTGHTLRLLSLPSAWKDFLTTSTHGASCLGPSSALSNQRDRYEQAVNTLRDGIETTVILVTRPDIIAIAEAERTSQELEAIGLTNQQLAINAVFKAKNRADKTALAFEERVNSALKHLPPLLASKVHAEFSLKSYNMVGIQALRRFFETSSESSGVSETQSPLTIPAGTLSIRHLVDGIVADGRCLVMVLGKGGVGKTTIASAIAVELASRGLPVHLSTTDPAAHLEATLAGESKLPTLTVSRIDPKIETQKYTDQVVASSGKGLDKEGLALLKEDLRSPCTEEVAVFRAFSRMVSEARDHFVILDTAPTGHTLLLLDATGSYHREVMKKFTGDGISASHVTTPMMRIKDPKFTKLLIVTLPETTPVSEAEALQKDLRRAEIEPYAWIINQSLAATQTQDPTLLRRAQLEVEQIKRIQNGLAENVIIVPWQIEKPTGIEHLLTMSQFEFKA